MNDKKYRFSRTEGLCNIEGQIIDANGNFFTIKTDGISGKIIKLNKAFVHQFEVITNE